MPDLSPDIERELDALDDALAGRRVAPDLTELGELALLLREDRPQPADGFGRFLDTRAERGFPGRDPRTRVSGRRWFAWHGWMTPALGVTTTVLLVTVIAVSARDGGDTPVSAGGGGSGSTALSQESDASGGTGTAAPEAARAQRSAGDEAAGLAQPQSALAPGSGSPGTDARDRRRVERSASLTLATRPGNIDAVSNGIQEVTRQHRGFVVSSTVSSSSSGGGGGTFELRIPTRNLDAAMAALSRLGAVRERAQRAQDITAQTVSARTRLKDARTERSSLLEQLAAAQTPVQTESIRARLRIVSAEIERARAAVRRVDNRAAFSTVAVTLVADRSAGGAAGTQPDDDGTWTPGDAAGDAVRVLEVAAGVALIGLAIALPLGLVAVLAALTLRFARRRRREQALDAV